ncbi:MAG: lytic transglycosylase [Xanthobacteraceae bacterium]|nr:MAG: lytic transglycosylase [Xanthobacteraceae bacterium]
MSGHLPATFRPAIRTGSWSPPRPGVSARPRATSGAALLAALMMLPSGIEAFARAREPAPSFTMPDSQFEPVAWADLPGWPGDDHKAAFAAFVASCRSIGASASNEPDAKALGHSLRAPCLAARAVHGGDLAARAFFETHFVALRIARLGEAAGFVTGYYEPILEGSRSPSEAFPVPVYRRPANLFVRGYRQSSAGLPNKGEVFRKIGRRKLVPYYDRGEIEDGALAGRSLELCWLKNQTDLLFMQIQGSARVRLDDGSVLRLNYDAHNGYPYTPVGRVLIERGIIPREEMSMQRIRQWMEDNPGGAAELRRQNRSYVFFREVKLSDADEPRGAQGVPLTAGRSIAVDKALHVYGTPFFIAGDLPSEAAFRRLMVAQDTGSAIIGPARADIYFGAGPEAGRIAGQLRHPAQFAILVPRALDPAVAARRQPLPAPRPAQKIARLFPQQPDAKPAEVKPAQATPLPSPRPETGARKSGANPRGMGPTR